MQANLHARLAEVIGEDGPLTALFLRYVDDAQETATNAPHFAGALPTGMTAAWLAVLNDPETYISGGAAVASPSFDNRVLRWDSGAVTFDEVP
jgi:hypothetical protein